MTSTEICTAEPRALPRQISILLRQAKMMAAACSAALPTMGTRMPLRNRMGILMSNDAFSMVLTIMSDSDEMKAVMMPSQTM